MQQTLREGGRERYIQEEGGAGMRKVINELGNGGENDERKRDKTGIGESITGRGRKRLGSIQIKEIHTVLSLYHTKMT